MAGSSVSDLLNLMYFLDHRDAKKRQEVEHKRGIKETYGGVGATEVPEDVAQQEGLAPEERSTKSTAHFKAFQQQGVKGLMDMQGELAQMNQMNQMMGMIADTPEKKDLIGKYSGFMRTQMTKRLKQHMEMYKIDPNEPGVASILGDLVGTGAMGK